MKTYMMNILKPSVLLLVVALSTFSFTSCKDDDEGGPAQSSAQFFAKVNGADFNPEFVTGFSQSLPNNILLTGGMGNGEQIQLFIPKDVTVGTYDYGDPTSSHIAYYQKIDGDALDVAAFATSGSITISEHDVSTKTLEGSFNFDGMIPNTQESFTITSGTFDLTYEALD